MKELFFELIRVAIGTQNDTVIYPDKVRLNCYYYRHYSFWKDIEMILATVLGWKVRFMEEEL